MKHLHAYLQPFATASVVLLVVLIGLEQLRPGFVTLFLDLRIVLVTALVLWVCATLTETEPHRRVGAIVFVVLVLAACIPILYKVSIPFGKLGLVVLFAGVFGLILCLRQSASSAK